ncbi:MAG TPA: sensor histidine kinase, partial [Acidimicrobiia bacterium]
MLGNLLTNALKYSRRGGRVVVAVGARERRAVISVRDDG